MKDDFSIKLFLCLICTYVTCVTLAKLTGYDYEIRPNCYLIAIILYVIKRISMTFCFPYNMFIVISTFFRDKKDKTETEIIKMTSKTICFRVVTRGMFPKLIIKNRDYNLSVLKGFENLRYTYEVVTDTKIEDIDTIERCHEVVVPDHYSTKTGAKFKARALQYALEQNVSNLADNDFVVHLDEETRLTKNCIIGILNFINENKHQIGQGELKKYFMS